MRLHFPNMTRPKKAAKRLSAAFPKLQLAHIQAAVAIACGYRDWHEFRMSHASAEPALLDEDLSEDTFRQRTTRITRSLSAALNIHDGDVQAAVTNLRLTGNRPFTRSDHEAIRTACWRAGPIPWEHDRQPGTIFRIKSKGFSKTDTYWWRQSRSGVRFIDHTTANGLCATFEAVVPRARPEDFIPRRLWLPYGWIDLENGHRVLFSRDYLPLWRIADCRVERLMPTENISGPGKRHWFGEGGRWSSGPPREAAEKMLSDYGITALPRLVDVLPILIHNENVDIKGAAKLLDNAPDLE